MYFKNWNLNKKDKYKIFEQATDYVLIKLLKHLRTTLQEPIKMKHQHQMLIKFINDLEKRNIWSITNLPESQTIWNFNKKPIKLVKISYFQSYFPGVNKKMKHTLKLISWYVKIFSLKQEILNPKNARSL